MSKGEQQLSQNRCLFSLLEHLFGIQLVSNLAEAEEIGTCQCRESSNLGILFFLALLAAGVPELLVYILAEITVVVHSDHVKEVIAAPPEPERDMRELPGGVDQCDDPGIIRAAGKRRQAREELAATAVAQKHFSRLSSINGLRHDRMRDSFLQNQGFGALHLVSSVKLISIHRHEVITPGSPGSGKPDIAFAGFVLSRFFAEIRFKLNQLIDDFFLVKPLQDRHQVLIRRLPVPRYFLVDNIDVIDARPNTADAGLQQFLAVIYGIGNAPLGFGGQILQIAFPKASLACTSLVLVQDKQGQQTAFQPRDEIFKISFHECIW